MLTTPFLARNITFSAVFLHERICLWVLCFDGETHLSRFHVFTLRPLFATRTNGGARYLPYIKSSNGTLICKKALSK